MAKYDTLINPDAIQTVKLTVSVDVTAVAPWYQDGFHGFAMNDAASGEELVLDVSMRTWQVNIGSLTGVVGEIIYITPAGVLTNTASTNRPFGRVTVAKDSSNVVDLLVLPQVVTNAS